MKKMQIKLNPDDFRYYRTHLANENDTRDVPTILTLKEARELLAVNVRSVDTAIKKLVKGQTIRTRYGIYWAKRLENKGPEVIHS